MARSVRISWKTAQALLALLPTHDERAVRIPAVEQLRAAMAPKRSVKAAAVRRVAKKKTKAASAKELRAALVERSRGLCEMGEFPHAGTDPHHALGRKGLKEGPHNCLWLCRAHHELVTNPGEEAPGYLRLQAAVFQEMGHLETAAELRRDAAFVESKITARAALSREAQP